MPILNAARGRTAKAKIDRTTPAAEFGMPTYIPSADPNVQF